MSTEQIEKLRMYFQPGKIVQSYAGRDIVIDFEECKEHSWMPWIAWVQAVDSDNNPIGPVRWHCTLPKLEEF